jgi:hypothetical protein
VTGKHHKPYEPPKQVIQKDRWVEAIAAYERGIPSLLTKQNPFKNAVEQHRWGYHYEKPRPNYCPVCHYEGGTTNDKAR